MAGVVFVAEGQTKDGKKFKVEVTLKKFCRCKPGKDNCQEEAKALAAEKLSQLLSHFESSQLFWLENQINPNFFMAVMEAVTEVLEDVCVTARSSHLQGAQVKVEPLGVSV
jgi:threonine synthase